MRGPAAIAAASILCAAWLRASASPPDPRRDGPPTPVVVELFTAEGCSSCPPADALLATLISSQPIEGAEVIALGQHVDYWNDLGWRDRFSSGAVTNRQRVYNRALNTESIYTPQLVIDGRTELVGSDGGGARRAIQRALDVPHGRVQIEVEPQGADAVALTISVSDLPQAGRGDRDEVVVAVTEDQLKTDVKRGENHGRVLTHVAVVRSLATVGDTASSSGPGRLSVPRVPFGQDWKRENLKIVAFVQEARSRHIVAAAWRPVAGARR
jgi:hypothetical protein